MDLSKVRIARSLMARLHAKSFIFRLWKSPSTMWRRQIPTCQMTANLLMNSSFVVMPTKCWWHRARISISWTFRRSSWFLLLQRLFRSSKTMTRTALW